LVGAWNLDKSEAVEAVQWLIAKVVAAVENSEAPTAALRPSNTPCNAYAQWSVGELLDFASGFDRGTGR
jgi:hypothetical protein